MENLVEKCTIKELDPLNRDQIMLLCLVIAKQSPKKITTVLNEDRAVWNFTVRDSVTDTINVAFWGSYNTLIGLYNCVQIGDTVEIRLPRILVRRVEDIGEVYRPPVSSPFYLVVNEAEGCVNAIPNRSFSNLLHIPLKPLTSYTTLAQIERNIKQMNGHVVDILVAVRQVGASRFVNTRNGMKEVRNFVVFDKTSPGMGITLWEREYILRSSFWKPRVTILYMTDMRVEYDAFRKVPKAGMNMRSVITENPEGDEARRLREYAKNAVLQSSLMFDYITAAIPDAKTVKTVMTMQQIYEKIQEITTNEVLRLEDQQFAAVIYGHVTSFDLDGFQRVLVTRCSSCRSVINGECFCENPLCLINTAGPNVTPAIETSFELRIQICDHTGTLPSCRMSGKAVEEMLECTAEEFSSKSDQEISALKWKFLMERCELRVMIWAKNADPIVTIITCNTVSADQAVQHL